VISITSTTAKPWQAEAVEDGSTGMKRLLILTALGLFLSAHGAVALMAI
jgi:hypothetical protein